AELDGTIRSVFICSRNAFICVEYPSPSHTSTFIYDPRFPRGYTLQEPLAPEQIEF
ncbi:hypothetical protein DFJ58DRAFT_692079, partial [Suillus subalutaceus]|uniref:uncharacterized protein n=1 Tax=Suillus subalutaceus TaxID=48586 RepID=UPI001B866889